MEQKDKEYIGDGVYVGHDGHHCLWLTTEDGERVTNQIALEPFVLTALVGYLDKIKKKYRPEEE